VVVVLVRIMRRMLLKFEDKAWGHFGRTSVSQTVADFEKEACVTRQPTHTHFDILFLTLAIAITPQLTDSISAHFPLLKIMPRRPLADIEAGIHTAQSSLTCLTYEAHPPSLDKQRVGAQGMHKIDQVGRDILRRNKPIQCLEAVMVAAHLTTKFLVHRLPLSFTTRVRETSQTHRHIVLALVCESHQRWGAMGMSRCAELMDKGLIFESLSALVEEYQRAYSACGHDLESVYVGLPFSSSPSCTLPVVWRALHIDLKTQEKNIEHTTSSLSSAWKAVLDHFGLSTQALLAFHHRHPRSTPSSAHLCAWLQEKKAALRLKDLLTMREEEQEEGEEDSGGGLRKGRERGRRKKKRAWLVPSPSGA